jgi:hypothetical protein
MQKTSVTLACDLTGVENETVRTVTFGIGSRTYVTDLDGPVADELEAYLEKFAAAARSAGGARAKPRTPANREESAEIRGWAKTQGLDVAEYGRLPKKVTDAWDNR